MGIGGHRQRAAAASASHAATFGESSKAKEWGPHREIPGLFGPPDGTPKSPGTTALGRRRPLRYRFGSAFPGPGPRPPAFPPQPRRGACLRAGGGEVVASLVVLRPLQAERLRQFGLVSPGPHGKPPTSPPCGGLVGFARLGPARWGLWPSASLRAIYPAPAGKDETWII